MILEEETFEAFGYYPKDLKHKSRKLIIAACERCGEFRTMSKHNYRTFCTSCIQKGNTHNLGHKHTNESKAKLSAIQKGEKNSMFGRIGGQNPMFGKHHSEDSKALMSAALKGDKHPNFGKRGTEAAGYKGGIILAWKRAHAKRTRELGYNILMPLAEGEVGHHVTNEHVIGIPAEVHERLSGYSRKNHRTLVMAWLKANDKKKYKHVLRVRT